MSDIKIIEVKQSVFADNNADAEKLRENLKKENTFLLNLMSSPGAGKTTLLLKLAEELGDHLKMAVMEADIDSDVDAAKMLDAGVAAIQIHTGGMCHLDADMTRQGLATLKEYVKGRESQEKGEVEASGIDLVVLENVGNLVCPAEFDTGAVANATILSVPEGDDKPLKYPLMYETCQLLIVSKTDVLPYFDFDCEKVIENARMRNPGIDVIFVSAKTGDGMDELAEWIVTQIKKWNN